jgi:hypothetical protein
VCGLPSQSRLEANHAPDRTTTFSDDAFGMIPDIDTPTSGFRPDITMAAKLQMPMLTQISCLSRQASYDKLIRAYSTCCPWDSGFKINLSD